MSKMSQSAIKPLIGINLDIKGGPPEVASIQTTYTDAIINSGGIPVLLPPMSKEDLASVVARLDGIMLIGGDDYCPSLYNEEPHDALELAHHRRQAFDLLLAGIALEKPDMPVLGICLGAQLINIQQGGSLVQDIKTFIPDSQVEHVTKNGWQDGFTRHSVKLQSGSQLATVYKDQSSDVPTSHHQSVKAVGRDLTVSAQADDGVIEAIEMPGRSFVIGVQWHPERDYETNKPLFDKLVEVSSRQCGAS